MSYCSVIHLNMEVKLLTKQQFPQPNQSWVEPLVLLRGVLRATFNDLCRLLLITSSIINLYYPFMRYKHMNACSPVVFFS